MSPMDTLTGPMFDALRSLDRGHITAKDIGADARVLNALCERGFLLADRTASQTFYEPTPMGLGAIAVLKAPVSPRPYEGTISRIQRAVAEHFGIALIEMTSARRSREVARPRQIAMYLARELTACSYPEIGRRFGNRDHTTVIHAVRTIEGLCDINYRGIADEVEALRSKLEPEALAA